MTFGTRRVATRPTLMSIAAIARHTKHGLRWRLVPPCVGKANRPSAARRRSPGELSLRNHAEAGAVMPRVTLRTAPGTPPDSPRSQNLS
jgi:hypothetical protein